MSYIKSLNELEHLAHLIEEADCPLKFARALMLKTPSIEIAYKMAVTLQGCVHFPKDGESRVYENIGKLDMSPITTVACSLGHTLLDGTRPEFNSVAEEKEFLEERERQCFHLGYWLISILFEDKRLVLRRGRFDSDTYKIIAKDKEYMDTLFYIVNTKPLDVPMKSRPAFRQPTPFTEINHKIAGDMVRAMNPKAREYFTIENCPEVFEAINRQMSTAYYVDMDLLKIFRDVADDKLFTLEGKLLTDEQREGILRERANVLDVAEGTKGRKFWEYAFYDYRGRMYSSAVWLTHQGSKLSKSLFRLAKAAPIGESGWVYLLIHAANCAGYDKALMDDKFLWADSQLNKWMKWAEDPVTHREWTEMDDPFCFLAAILEIKRAMAHPGGPYDYRSGLSVAWDATCSGLQVLSSLGKSVEEGEYCNITKSDERGDYYEAIAEEVWKQCVYTEAEEERYLKIMSRFDYFNTKIRESKTDKTRKKYLDKRRDYAKGKGKELYKLAKVFWGQPDKVKLRRKLCKRPCMTYFYSCRERTASKQLKNDWASEEGFEDLNSTFCFWLCVEIIKACEAKMPTSTELMEMMIDMGLTSYRKTHKFSMNGMPASKSAIIKKLDEEYGVKHRSSEFDAYVEQGKVQLNKGYVEGGEDFGLIAPRTKFLFMQDYKSPKIERLTVPYLDKTLKLEVMVGKKDRLDFAKIKSATSPNFVHMLDAQIAAAILLDTNYDVSCIHDSFGTTPANAGKLYEDIREVFVSIFDCDLLEQLKAQKNYSYDFVYGELDVKDIIINDYAFS